MRYFPNTLIYRFIYLYFETIFVVIIRSNNIESKVRFYFQFQSSPFSQILKDFAKFNLYKIIFIKCTVIFQKVNVHIKTCKKMSFEHIAMVFELRQIKEDAQSVIALCFNLCYSTFLI